MKVRFKKYLSDNYTCGELEEILSDKKELQNLTLKDFKELIDSMYKREFCITLEFDTVTKELKVISD